MASAQTLALRAAEGAAASHRQSAVRAVWVIRSATEAVVHAAPAALRYNGAGRAALHAAFPPAHARRRFIEGASHRDLRAHRITATAMDTPTAGYLSRCWSEQAGWRPRRHPSSRVPWNCRKARRAPRPAAHPGWCRPRPARRDLQRCDANVRKLGGMHRIVGLLDRTQLRTALGEGRSNVSHQLDRSI